MSTQLCSFCHTNPKNPKGGWCESCFQKSKQSGKCKNCQIKPSNPGYPWCESCFQKSRNGLCDICNKRPKNKGYEWCQQCFDSQNQKGSSSSCKKCKKNAPNSGYSLCESCYKASSTANLSLKTASPTKRQDIENQFRVTWTKGPTPTVLEVLEVHNGSTFTRYNQYKSTISRKNGGNPNERRRWHGTTLTCSLHQTKTVCNDPNCIVCCICKTGFDIKFASSSSFQRFGSGLYFAPNSSKSNDYSCASSPVKALFLCKVVAGQVHKTLNDMTNLKKPPNGCDSVSGEVGYALNYPELIVYESNAAMPAYIVFYS